MTDGIEDLNAPQGALPGMLGYTEFVRSVAAPARALTIAAEHHDLLHAVFGIAAEYFEYRLATTLEEKIEELGDMLWFIELACPEDVKKVPDSLEHAVESMVSAAKAALFYNKGTQADTLRVHCGAVRYSVLQELLKITMQENYKKLSKRYPEGFSQKAATERKDKENADPNHS